MSGSVLSAVEHDPSECPPFINYHTDCKAAAGLNRLFTALLNPIVAPQPSLAALEEKWIFRSTDGTLMEGTWFRFFGDRIVMFVKSRVLGTLVIFSAFDADGARMQDVAPWMVTAPYIDTGDLVDTIGEDRAWKILHSFLDNPLEGSVMKIGT
ncbi:hypothetical protein FA13DRAFT_1741716, partial [Coprinellus micaceus]